MSEAVFVQGLTKVYDGKTAVDHLSFSVQSGTVFGLLGANGAGKSTTIECILGTKQADAGTVRLLGQDKEKVLDRLMKRIHFHLQYRAQDMEMACAMFSKEYGLLGKTDNTEELIGKILNI